MDDALKERLTAQADASFLAFTRQLDHLLNTIDFYFARYPAENLSLDHKHDQLKQVVLALGSLPRRLADVLRLWKHDQPRVLSRLGVELEILNELWIQVDVTQRFFRQEGIDCHPFDTKIAFGAWVDLTRINRFIP
jgi:hypothetical protein